jgi:hypothetical protein
VLGFVYHRHCTLQHRLYKTRNPTNDIKRVGLRPKIEGVHVFHELKLKTTHKNKKHTNGDYKAKLKAFKSQSEKVLKQCFYYETHAFSSFELRRKYSRTLTAGRNLCT